MKLLIHEIKDSVFQTFVPKKNIIISAVRPHLYIHNIPTGSLKIQITTLDDALITESSSILISDITSSNEYHGYITFYINAYLQKDVKYKFKVVSGDGYSFSESSYCAVCNDYDLRKYNQETPSVHKWLSPLDIEIWSLSTK